MNQLSLFDPRLPRASRLIAESPRRAFYDLRLEQTGLRFIVAKTSGAGNRVLDRRAWNFDSLAEAERFFERKIREKTNPGRRSPRTYRISEGNDFL